jgi:hypothetical protein
LAFTLADEYYPHQEYTIAQPSKEYEAAGIVGYGVYTSRFRIKEGGMERAIPFIDAQAVGVDGIHGIAPNINQRDLVVSERQHRTV